MKALALLTTAVCASLLSACGGSDSGSSIAPAPIPTGTAPGSGGTPAPGPVPTPPTPIAAKSVAYADVNFLQDINNLLPYTATFTDNGVGVAGTLSFGKSPVTVSMTPAADGGVVSAVAIGSNTADSTLPAVAMICQSAASTGLSGTNGGKSTDVLVANSATRILSSKALANQTFTYYREDCLLGGTFPPVATGQTFSFDANGNATIVTPSGTLNYTAAQADAVLNGTPATQQVDPMTTAYRMFYAFSYKKLDGSTAYVLVEHGAPATTGLTRAYVAVWTQQ
jgi:hypothetical protein